MLFIFIASF